MTAGVLPPALVLVMGIDEQLEKARVNALELEGPEREHVKGYFQSLENLCHLIKEEL